jgi:D-glucuronyl C5-epimerase-like protein
MIERKRIAVAAAIVASCAAAAPAHAGEVIVVGPDGAERVRSGVVPSAAEASLGPEPRTSGVRAGAARTRARSSSARGRRAVSRALWKALRAKRIDSADYRRWRRDFNRARGTMRGLNSARRGQLGYVLGQVESLALRGLLTPSRMPSVFAQLARNALYWNRYAYPAVGDQVSFRGSGALYQHYAGSGLQLQPLSTFKKANALHGACEREESSCDREALHQLLDEMAEFATDRGRGVIAWEYLFHFGGGTPPWISGMAQATGIQAYARAARLLDEPRYLEIAQRALRAFEVAPPRGVRTTGPRGGVHYLQYSFAPRLYIFNAFLQSLIGLHDYAKISEDARAQRLYDDAEPEARREVPLSDVGDWSRYSYRGRESTREYHELLREFLASMCSRRLGELYCTYAERYESYMTDPPELTYTGPVTARRGRWTRLRFRLSKLSVVEVQVYKDGRLAFNRLATYRRGSGSFLWKPRSAGLYSVRIAAKELRTGRSLRGRDSGELEVLAG